MQYRYDLIGKRVETDKGWGRIVDVDYDGELYIDLDNGLEIMRMPNELLSVSDAPPIISITSFSLPYRHDVHSVLQAYSN